jgi:outer membrane biosynthesis protein TonB
VALPELEEKPIEELSYLRKTDPVAVAGGAFGVILMAGVISALPVIAAAGGADEATSGDAEPFEYIEARLLKYGEEKDPEALPDRIVPAQPTAPEDVLPLDRNENKKEPEKKEEKPKPQADAVTDNKLRQVFEKARAFAEIQDDYVPEGHPDGVPEGEVTDPALASMGATYGHRIKRLFLERWVVPTLLPEAALKKLSAKVNIRVDINMVIISATFLKKSGNPMFDDSVQNAIDRVRQEVRTLPPPPEAIASNIFGGGINLKFNGREATYE